MLLTLTSPKAGRICLLPIKGLFYLHNSLNYKYEYGKKKALESWLPCSRITPVGEEQQQTLVFFLSPTELISFALSSDSSAESVAAATWQSAWGGLQLVTLPWHGSDSGLAEQTDLHFTLRGQKSKLKGSAKQRRQHNSSDHLLYALKTKQLPKPLNVIKMPKAEKRRDNYCTIIHNIFMSQNPLCMNFSFFL